MKRLEKAAFLEVVRNTPLVAIDLVVINLAGEVLLGHRVNKPAQNTWFVPGGRIRKDETLSRSFQRTIRDELGLDLDVSIAPGGNPVLKISNPVIREINFKGVFEHLYPENFAGVEDITTHYITLAYQIHLAEPLTDLPGEQHSAYQWWKVDDLLTSPNVHENSKLYFR